jgi:YVTN family beta-propeller protein
MTRTRNDKGSNAPTRRTVRAGGLLLAFALAAASMAAPLAPAHGQDTGPVAAGAKAYVALVDDNEVAVVDTRTNHVLGYIPGILGPHDLVASPDGRVVYVGNDGVPVVSVIDTSNDSVVASIRVGFFQRGLALSPDGRDLLVSLGSVGQEVLSIDTTTLQIRGRLAIAEPGRIAVSPDGRLAYVISAEPGAAALVVIDLATLRRTTTIRLNEAPTALHFAPDGKRLYLTMADMRSILTLDPAQNRLVGRIAVPLGSRHLVPAEDGRSILVVNSAGGAGTLDVVDLARGTVSRAVIVGTAAPAWVAADQDTRTAYVTNERSGDVSVIDLASGTVAAKITVGQGAGEIVLSPAAEPGRR